MLCTGISGFFPLPAMNTAGLKGYGSKGIMNLEKFLLQNRSSILKTWLDLIWASYPPDTRRFLKDRNDRFANPVGFTIQNEIENLFKELVSDKKLDADRISPVLDKIIKIRATQDFTPSQAIAFVFLLKRAIRENIDKERRENSLFEDLLRFESKIDEVALLAFDIHLKCREKLYEISANHAKNQVSGLLRRMGLTCELPEWNTKS